MNTQSQTLKSRKGERGNVLFLILIAVALFAALSYAVTQSTRSGGGDASKEKSLVSSAALTQYPASIKTAIVRMMVSGGVDVTNLNFAKPVNFAADLKDPEANPAPTGVTPENTTKNAVFYSNGGGATYSDAGSDVSAAGTALPWYFNAENEVVNIGTTASSGVATGSVDVIAFLPGISKAVCQKIHEQLGLLYQDADATNAFPVLSGIVTTLNMDNKTAGSTHIQSSPSGGRITSSVLNGQPQGCFRTATSSYVYYHVLVER